jgi:hypothetical protein
MQICLSETSEPPLSTIFIAFHRLVQLEEYILELEHKVEMCKRRLRLPLLAKQREDIEEELVPSLSYLTLLSVCRLSVHEGDIEHFEPFPLAMDRLNCEFEREYPTPEGLALFKAQVKQLKKDYNFKL